MVEHSTEQSFLKKFVFMGQTLSVGKRGKLSKSLSVENSGLTDGKSKSTEVKNSGKVLVNWMGFCVGFQWIFPRTGK